MGLDLLKRSLGSSFIGSTPSTVLFFVALCIGIVIAIMFVFFTFRYLVRSRYGMYMPSPGYIGSPFEMHGPSRNTMSPLAPYIVNDGANYVVPYSANNHYTPVARRKKMTQDEVEEKFPATTFAEWMTQDVGDDDSNVFVDAVQQASSNRCSAGPIEGSSADEKKLKLAAEATEKTAVTTATDSAGTASSVEKESEADAEKLEGDAEKPETDAEKPEGDASGATDEDHPHALHFTSGECNICLETFEDDDEVRGLPCGHVFHDECIDPWLTNRRACCPTCKRDFLAEPEETREARNPDFQDIDSIFSLDGQPLSPFAYRKPTEFKAKTLLVCLQMIRSGQYHTDGPVDFDDDPNNNNNGADSDDDDSNNNASATPVVDPNSIAALGNPSYEGGDEIDGLDPNLEGGRYYQKMASVSFDSPPLPDTTEVNPKIRSIILSHPFNERDLSNVDQLAYQATMKMFRWYSVPFWKVMGISKLDLYYHFVVWFFTKKKDRRIFANREAEAGEEGAEGAAEGAVEGAVEEVEGDAGGDSASTASSTHPHTRTTRTTTSIATNNNVNDAAVINARSDAREQDNREQAIAV